MNGTNNRHQMDRPLRRGKVSFVLFGLFALLRCQGAFGKDELNAADLKPPARSIYQINPALDAAIIGLSAAGSLWAYTHSDSLIHPRCPCDRSEVNRFDRSVIGNASDLANGLSDITVALSVAAPVALDYLDVGLDAEFTEDMVVYAETLAVNGGLVTLAKYTVQRPLPRTYAGDKNLVNSPGGYRSFYSGHTSVAVSALSTGAYTFTARHPDRWWPWVVTGLVGTSVAVERVLAGRHFYSDVIVGALMGAGVGLSIPALHRRSSGSSQKIAFVPVEDGGALLWSAKF